MQTTIKGTFLRQESDRNLNISSASIVSQKSQHLANILDEVKNLNEELDEIDFSFLTKYKNKREEVKVKYSDTKQKTNKV